MRNYFCLYLSFLIAHKTNALFVNKSEKENGKYSIFFISTLSLLMLYLFKSIIYQSQSISCVKLNIVIVIYDELFRKCTLNFGKKITSI